MDFYGLAAQVIPVLYLAMLFESRHLTRKPDSYFERDGEPRFWNASQPVGWIALVILMGVGEVTALLCVWQRVTLPIADAVVVLALLSGVLGVGGPPIAQEVRYLRQHRAAGGGWQMPAFIAAALLALLIGPLSWLAALAP
ncbi:hypothetical protein [Brachybacterium sp. UNK5269]|uniref:hypothetical protein n=1 Tax=Brachybacterium sp. UNK5269 TaxID=3408576 RepID=UPI003BAFE41D